MTQSVNSEHVCFSPGHGQRSDIPTIAQNPTNFPDITLREQMKKQSHGEHIETLSDTIT